MSLLDHLQRRSLEDPSTPLTGTSVADYVGGYTTDAGITITPENSHTVSAVYNAVSLIAGVVGSLPLQVFREAPDGSKAKIKTAGNRFLWGRPNPSMSKQVFWETMIGNLLTWGNAYALKIRDNTGAVAALWPLRPDRVVVKGLDSQLKKLYLVDNKDEYTMRDILHIPYYGLNGVTGLSVVTLAKQSLGLTLAAEKYGAKVFSNGTSLSGVIEVTGKLKIDEAAALAKQWQLRHGGLMNSHKPAILDNGAKWHEVGLPPEDTQFLETRRFQVVEVARWFKVPPHLIGAVEVSSSWGSGIAEQNLAWLNYGLLPTLIRVEEELTDDTDLLPLNHYVKHNVEGFLRSNSAARYTAYKTAHDSGWLSVNEIREKEDLDPVSGGDAYIQPLNMGTLGNTDNANQNTNA
jgi:HK97 family phage portal protein